MKLSDSDQCAKCKEIDYIEHFFYFCSRLKGFWEYVACKITNYTQKEIRLTQESVLFGISVKNNLGLKGKNLKITNHIILIGKMAISKLRYGKINNIFLIFDVDLAVREKFLV